MRGNRRVVKCKHCQFERVVTADDSVRPGEILLHHGRQTGHELRVDALEF